jgi:hypothetical protein
MGTLETLGLALGTAWTAGINLYATVAVLGIAHAAGWMVLPPGLEVLADPLVITVAMILYFVEFFADKVPVLDSGWDAIHTFIRVPAGALLAARALGPMNPGLEVAAALAGGSVALAAHGTKATTRLAINASPEPFTNWAASITEDVLAIFGVWLALEHPIVMLTAVVLFVVAAAILIPKILRALATLFRKLTGRGQPPATSAPPTTQVLPL